MAADLAAERLRAEAARLELTAEDAARHTVECLEEARRQAATMQRLRALARRYRQAAGVLDDTQLREVVAP